ncbi:unnamed protein product [Candida verbasci]|uniref:PX domain-containing protein n=1 Tax=Candida verbasci TaxID=1227364 RepID=A0A9W4TZI1_9ASCO|nr:unnamed protein product [Candida verbasci]
MDSDDLGTSVWDDALPKDDESKSHSNLNTFQSSSIGPLTSQFSNYSINDDPFRNPLDYNKSEEYDDEEEQEEEQAPVSGTYDALREQEIELRKEHKQQLINNLTHSEDSRDQFEKDISKVSSDTLFQDSNKNSPIKIDLNSQSVTSPTRNSININKFKPPRLRKYNSKTNVKHLNNSNTDILGPLGGEIKNEDEVEDEEDVKLKLNHAESIVQEANGPLYQIKNVSTPVHSPKKLKVEEEDSDPNSNKLEISVGEPMKVGDITNAHIVYKIKTRNKNKESNFFPDIDEVEVTRRYKDFRWLYKKLQTNNPARIIPPPPSKQTYIGRFNESFIENRKIALERMLIKISKKKHLQNDADFVRFLTQEEINTNMENEIINEKTASGFLSIFQSKEEPTGIFKEKKIYITQLEQSLKELLRAIDQTIVQKNLISSNLNEIVTVLSEISFNEKLITGFITTQEQIIDVFNREILQSQNLIMVLNENIQILEFLKDLIDSKNGIDEDYSKIIKEEIDEFDLERIAEFRNAVELWLENTIESQKEAIEIYETFIERNDL